MSIFGSMFYSLLITDIILGAIIIYLVVAIIDLAKQLAKLNRYNLLHSKWNILIIILNIIIRHFKKHVLPVDANISTVDAQIQRMSGAKCVKYSTVGTIILTFIWLVLIALTFVTNQMESMMVSALSSAVTIFNKEECTCYAKCTNDNSDDEHTAYELVYGPNEYNTLTGHMNLKPYEMDDPNAEKRNADPESTASIINNGTYNAFDGLLNNTLLASASLGSKNNLAVLDNVDASRAIGSIRAASKKADDGTIDFDNVDPTSEVQYRWADCLTGQQKNYFLTQHLNNDMLLDYKNVLNSTHSSKNDNLNRSSMNNDQLQDDLRKMLADYKVNGRNPSCPVCNTLGSTALGHKCSGAEHYKEGRVFNSVTVTNRLSADEIPVTPPPETPSSNRTRLGRATGPYAISLGEDSYYWYHQSQEDCVYNVDKFGSVTIAGGASAKASARACSIYSTAIALSNVLGRAITPKMVVEEVLAVRIQNNTANLANNTNGILSNSGGSQMQMNKDRIASRTMEVYGSEGLKAYPITANQTNVDKALADGGVVVFSIGTIPGWRNSTSGSHFITIMKKVGDSYYHLNSSDSDRAGFPKMKTAKTWAQIAGQIKGDGRGVVYIGPEIDDGGGGDLPPTGDKWANETSSGISYDWSKQVYIEGQGVKENPGCTKGHHIEFTVNGYRNYKPSKGTYQKKIRDVIGDDIQNNNGYAMHDGCLLVVAPNNSTSWVGHKGTLIDGYGKTLNVIYVDTKGNKGADVCVGNTDAYTFGPSDGTVKGHLISGVTNVLEIESDHAGAAEFKATFGLDLTVPLKGFTLGESLIG